MGLIYGIPTEIWVLGIIVILSSLLYPIIFKKRILKNFEKTIQKSMFTWVDKSGKEHSEEVLFKKSKIPLIGDWGRVYPPINEDGSMNWTNLTLGGKKNFIKLLIILLILGLVVFWVVSLLGVSKEYLNGQRYIIVEKEAFDKFCTTKIVGYEQQAYFEKVENLTIFRVNKTIEEN